MPFAWKRLIEQVYGEWCAQHDLAPLLRHIGEPGSRDEIHRVARVLLRLVRGEEVPTAIRHGRPTLRVRDSTRGRG